MKIFLLAIWSLMAAFILLAGSDSAAQHGHLHYGYLVAGAFMFVFLKMILAGYPRGSSKPDHQRLSFWFGCLLLLISLCILFQAYEVISSGVFQATGSSPKAAAAALLVNLMGSTFGPAGAALVYVAFALVVGSCGFIIVRRRT